MSTVALCQVVPHETEPLLPIAARHSAQSMSSESPASTLPVYWTVAPVAASSTTGELAGPVMRMSESVMGLDDLMGVATASVDVEVRVLPCFDRAAPCTRRDSEDHR